MLNSSWVFWRTWYLMCDPLEYMSYWCKGTDNGKCLVHIPGPVFTKKTPSYQHRDSHYKPETVVRPSEVYIRDPYTRKTASVFLVNRGPGCLSPTISNSSNKCQHYPWDSLLAYLFLHPISSSHQLLWLRNLPVRLQTEIVLGTSRRGYELSWVRVVLGSSCLGYDLSWVRVVLGTSCPGSGQLLPKTTRTQDNSYPGQLVPMWYHIIYHIIDHIIYHIISYKIRCHAIRYISCHTISR